MLSITPTCSTPVYHPNPSQELANVEKLHRAIMEQKSLKEILPLITKKTVNAHVEGKTAIHLAVGNVSLLKALLENEADINALTENEGHSALFLAVDKKEKDSLALLINNQANLDSSTKKGETPLYLAVKKGYSEMVRTLLDQGADPEIKFTEREMTALHLAPTLEIFKVLLERGDLYAKTKDNCNVLHTALREGRLGIAHFLISETDIDINEKGGEDEWTALHFAADHEYLETAKLLLEKGADLHAETKSHLTPFFLAVQTASQSIFTSPRIIEFFLSKGAKYNQDFGPNLGTALHTAARGGKVWILEILLNAGADIEASKTSEDGISVLGEATSNGNVEAVKYLIKNGALVNKECGPNKMCALQFAAASYKFNTFIPLIEAGADVFITLTLTRETLLHSASQYGNDALVTYCLETGLSHMAYTEAGLTPLHVAAFHGFPSVIEILMKAGSPMQFPIVKKETPFLKALQGFIFFEQNKDKKIGRPSDYDKTFEILLEYEIKQLDRFFNELKFNDKKSVLNFFHCLKPFSAYLSFLNDFNMPKINSLQKTLLKELNPFISPFLTESFWQTSIKELPFGSMPEELADFHEDLVAINYIVCNILEPDLAETFIKTYIDPALRSFKPEQSVNGSSPTAKRRKVKE